MSILLPTTRGSRDDRDKNSFRESPQHGIDYPARAVIIENDNTDPIPVYITDAEPGTPTLITDERATDPGNQQELISFVVGVGVTLDLYQARVVTRVHGKWRVTVDGQLVGSGRTGPSISELSQFSWSPRLSATSGQNVKVLFTAHADTPMSEVEAYLNGSSRP
jgi:hypothetical protein